MRWGRQAQLFTPRELRGYTKDEETNPGVEVDNKEVFELGNERPLVPGRLFTGPNVLPPDHIAPDFAKAHTEILRIVVSRLVPGLCRALALALGLVEDFFSSRTTEEGMLMTQRASYYPAKKGVCGDAGRVIVAKNILRRGMARGGRKGGSVRGELRQHVDVLDEWKVLPFFVYPNAETEMIPIGKGEDMKLISGEVYAKDVDAIWKQNDGAGRWARKCDKSAACNCWRCM
ncbi:Isopenicillin N synthase-like protein [Gracilaria domingensis]|nr:Isopenicillin N synthase-like protein [Gracilaria domingensis]